MVTRKYSFCLLMRRGRFGLQVLLALTIALATASSPLFAQVKSSAITGTVADSSGAILPGAKVTVRLNPMRNGEPAGGFIAARFDDGTTIGRWDDKVGPSAAGPAAP